MVQPAFDVLFKRPAMRFERGTRAPSAGLALSGGGFRAMLFHTGSLRRLYEIGALTEIDRISSVSGGSIASAQLGLHWDELASGQPDMSLWETAVQTPLFNLAGETLDVKSSLVGLVRPGRSIAQTVARRYDAFFDNQGLQALPSKPRFVFCATNLGTGALVRFAAPYTADQTVGKRDKLELPLGSVVAASAAFPPMLSPMVIELSANQAINQPFADGSTGELANTSFATRLELSDGGVYDNLGLQPVSSHHTILASDAGGPFKYEKSVPKNWLVHMTRAWNVADTQVRSLRRSALIADFQADRHRGAFWGISTQYSAYGRRTLAVHDSWADYLRAVPTRLSPVDELVRKQLINFAYCLTDAAIASFVVEGEVPEPTLPYPDAPLAGSAPKAFKPKPVWKFWK